MGEPDKLANPMTLYELLAAAAVALTIYATWHRSRKPLGLLMILLGSVITAHLVFRIAGVSVIEAQAIGWTFASPPKASLTLPWAFFSDGYPWQALPGLIGNFIAVIFVTAVSTLFNTTGLEVAAHREADIERELNATGAANILAGVLGGYAGCISISRSLLNRNSGATGRLSASPSPRQPR